MDSDGHRRPVQRRHPRRDRHSARSSRSRAKAAAVLLVFLFRRRDFTGIVDGVVIAGFTATGFAFTENILYLGTAFGDRPAAAATAGIASVTAATFFVRVVMSPFAHPLFTVLTGIGFGIAALVRASASAYAGCCCRWPGCCSRWACTRCGTARRRFGEYGFFAVYAAFMVPAFGLLTWLVDLDPAARAAHRARGAARVRRRRLADPGRAVRARLDAGAAAGPRVRAARHFGGQAAARAVARVRGVRDLPGVPAPPGAARARRAPTSSYGSGSCCTSCGGAGTSPARAGPRGPDDGAAGTGAAPPWPAYGAYGYPPHPSSRPDRRCRTPRTTRTGRTLDQHRSAARAPPGVRAPPRPPPHTRPLRRADRGAGRSAPAPPVGTCARVRPTPRSGAPASSLRQHQVRHRQQGRELLHRAGGGDRGGDRRLGGQPGEGDRGDLGAVGLGDLVEGGEDPRPALGLQVLAGARGPGAVDRRAGAVLAGEEAGGEREVRDGGQAGARGDVLRARPRRCRGRPGCSAAGGRRSGPGPRGRRSPGTPASRSGEMLEAAIARTLPSFTSSSSAVMISSTGTLGLVEVRVVEVDVVGAEAAQRRVGARP